MSKCLKIILLIVIFSNSFTAFSQYKTEWAQTFGGDGWDEANTCIETRDGDYLVGGFARWQEHHLWLVKMHPDGTGRWGKTYADFFTSAANSMVQTYDSSIVITGYTIRKREFQSNLLVMKIDTVGNVLWQKVYGEDGDEQGYKIIETKDHGYAICGFTSSNNDAAPSWYMLRLDENGNKLWDKQFMGGEENRAMSIAETYDGGFVVTGYIGQKSGGRKNMVVIKLDSEGEEQWLNWYDFNDWCSGSSVISTRDSNIVVAGFTRVNSITDYDALIMKLNSDGDSLWVQTWGNGDWEEATDVIETYDNAFVMCGFSKSNIRDNSNFFMVKYDSRGNQMWSNIFKRKSQDYPKELVETRDNGLLLAGTTNSFGKGWDMAVLKMYNIERTDLQFSFPSDSISSTLNESIDITLCLNSFGIPNSVKVFVNDNMQVYVNEFHKPSDAEKRDGCDFPLSYNVNLNYGINTVKFVVKDYKNYEFEKQIIVYRLPKYEFVR
ncbi:MAG: hypothetical protein MJ211_00575 [Bacteroidales bacterium]|nr:hypothetical protein [Bacteroidales bacterium]